MWKSKDCPLWAPAQEARRGEKANQQSAIVRFLDHVNRKIDGFIRAKRRLIGLLNEQKQAIIHRAVTCGLHSDVPLKPSGRTPRSVLEKMAAVQMIGVIFPATDGRQRTFPRHTQPNNGVQLLFT